MDKLLKFAIVVAVLLAGGGVFYHYVIFLPKVERTKQEQITEENRIKQVQIDEAKRAAESERQEAARKDLAKQVGYEQCLQTARVNYAANWATACKLEHRSSLSLASNFIVKLPI